MIGLADSMLEFFSGRGCSAPAIPLLQPADPLLDTAGEDLRRRIFITTDRTGASLCLRPEFTIPVCLFHLAQGGGKARYGYAGKVFRQRTDEPEEFLQAGIEDIGEDNRIAADVAAIADCMEAVQLAGVQDFRLIVGDQALFEAVLAALELPRSWQKRLGRAFGDMNHLRTDIARLSADNGDDLGELPEPVDRLIAAGDRPGVENWIAERMSESGLPASGGRTAAEIAKRMMEKAELAAARLDPAQRAALDAFLAIEVPVAQAPEQLEAVAAKHGLSVGAAIAEFEARVHALDAHGLLAGDITYRAGFGRRLDYYTGLVFEIQVDGVSRPIAGGGRYDRLISLLDASSSAPAVGFSIWLDRLAAAGGSAP